ncbi:MAG TPA: maleylacetoacetate isomerase [Burkholderiaceae bacterium]|jgi:maleylpyruvate isomerase|nr:maleylacetoacetate isomerase [Burkholderiaceae bacterium]
MIKLHNYFRSSASFRVRIALKLKGLPYEYVPVHLLKGGGEQLAPSFRALNPESLVPVVDDDGAILTQSLAIIEYLDETRPEPRLLPPAAIERAYVRSIALAIACDIHPLNNLRVLRYLVNTLGVTEEQKNAWYRYWVEQGLASVEARLVAERRSGRYALGNVVTLADVFIVPQIFNAQRMDCSLNGVPTVMGIFDNCMQLPAFMEAQPALQPDASA